MKITIIGRLPGQNEIIDANRRVKNLKHGKRYFAGASFKKQWTNYVANQCLGKTVKEPVFIHYIWYEQNKRRDPDNFTSGGRKMINDGLQSAGVIKNDGWKNIKGFKDTWKVDKDNPRVELIIKEVK